jgi:hypothetical protein
MCLLDVENRRPSLYVCYFIILCIYIHSKILLHQSQVSYYNISLKSLLYTWLYSLGCAEYKDK